MKKNSGKLICSVVMSVMTLMLVCACQNAAVQIPLEEKKLDSDVEMVVVKGVADIGDAVSSEIANASKYAADLKNDRTRSAGIKVPSNIQYSGTAVATDGTTANVIFSENIFSVSLAVGKTWTITINAECFDSEGKLIARLSASETKELTSSDSVFNKTFLLSPLTDGSGTVKLEVSYIDTPVSKVTLTCISENKDKWNASNIAVRNIDGSNYIAALNDGSVPSGSYSVEIDFYSSENVLLFTTEQNINVFDGAETNYWINNGGSTFINNGKLQISKEHLKYLILSKIYVDANGSSGATGTWVDPVNSFAEACKKICSYRTFEEQMPSGYSKISQFEIILKSDVTETETSTIYMSEAVTKFKVKIHSDSSEIRKISAVGADSFGQMLFVQGKDASNRADVILESISISNNDIRAIKLANSNLTIKNCEICNNKVTDNNYYGAGIYCDDSSKVTASGKNIITGNILTKNGKTMSSNLYLSSDSANKQIPLYVSGDIKGSKIGVSIQNAPVSSSDKVAFTSGYKFGVLNGSAVRDIFTSDDEKYGVFVSKQNETLNEAVLTSDGGSVKIAESGNLKISTTTVKVPLPDPKNTKIVFTVKDADGNNITNNCTISVTIYFNQDILPTDNGSGTKYYINSISINKSIEMQDPNLQKGTYFIFVEVSDTKGNSGLAEFHFTIQ